MSESYAEQVKRLWRQTAPRSEQGGRKVLYRCPTCTRLWLQDGSIQVLELSSEQITGLLVELGAQWNQLPLATCRICSAGSGGQLSIDQYNDSRARAQAFGFSYEGVHPTGIHLLATVMNERYAVGLHGVTPAAQIVTDVPRCRQVLTWLQSLPVPPRCTPLSSQAARQMAMDNLPGHNQPGTEHFRWHGADWKAHCQALGGRVSVSMAQAVPENVPYSLKLSLQCWKLLAERLQHGGIAGEEERK